MASRRLTYPASSISAIRLHYVMPVYKVTGKKRGWVHRSAPGSRIGRFVSGQSPNILVNRSLHAIPDPFPTRTGNHCAALDIQDIVPELQPDRLNPELLPFISPDTRSIRLALPSNRTDNPRPRPGRIVEVAPLHDTGLRLHR